MSRKYLREFDLEPGLLLFPRRDLGKADHWAENIGTVMLLNREKDNSGEWFWHVQAGSEREEIYPVELIQFWEERGDGELAP